MSRYWIAGLLLGAVAGASVAFLSTPIYRASVTVIPVSAQETGGALARIAGQFGGLAGLAGIGLPTGDVRNEAVALLKSQAFAEQMIVDEAMMAALFPEKWDAETGDWRAMAPRDVPTLWDAWLLFDKKMRSVIEDRERGLVTVRMEFSDRELAAHWANTIVERINRQMREQKLADIDRSLDYLRVELAQADLVELRQAIAKVMEAQVNERMIAYTRADYAFRVLDPARAPDPDRPVFPNKALIIVISTVAGALLGLFAGMLTIYVSSRRRKS